MVNPGCKNRRAILKQGMRLKDSNLTATSMQRFLASANGIAEKLAQKLVPKTYSQDGDET
jgi:hypothetical protein